MLTAREKQQRRASRTRYRIKTQRHPRPRLSVHRSDAHIYAQLIDDQQNKTIASASSLADLKKELNGKGASKATARQVGKLVAERAIKAGVKEVVFDKGPYKYHGQVAELAAGAREAGLEF